MFNTCTDARTATGGNVTAVQHITARQWTKRRRPQFRSTGALSSDCSVNSRCRAEPAHFLLVIIVHVRFSNREVKSRTLSSEFCNGIESLVEEMASLSYVVYLGRVPDSGLSGPGWTLQRATDSSFFSPSFLFLKCQDGQKKQRRLTLLGVKR